MLTPRGYQPPEADAEAVEAGLGSARDTRRSVIAQRGTDPESPYPPAMIRVYRSPDGVGRCITFDDAHEPPPPLELVRAFSDDERQEAWRLLHELGGEAPVA